MTEQSAYTLNGGESKGFRMSDGPEGKLYTLQEVAEWAKISVPAVRAMIHRQELRALKMGRLYRVRQEDLDAWAAQQHAVPPSEDIQPTEHLPPEIA